MCRSQICNTIQNLSFYTIVSKQTCYFGVIACEVLFHVTAHLPYIKLLNEGNNKKDNPIGVSKVWFAGMQGVSHPLVYMSLPHQNFSFLMRTSTHRDTQRHTPLVLHSIYSRQCHANITQIWNLTFTKGDTVYREIIWMCSIFMDPKSTTVSEWKLCKLNARENNQFLSVRRLKTIQEKLRQPFGWLLTLESSAKGNCAASFCKLLKCSYEDAVCLQKLLPWRPSLKNYLQGLLALQYKHIY